MKEFETYLFDFDGTLVDSHDSLIHVFKGAYAVCGIDVDESIVRRLMRIPLWQGYEELKAPEDKKQEFGDAIIRLLNDEEILRKTKKYEEVEEVLISLHKKGKKLGIVTSNNRKHVHDVLTFINLDEKLFSVVVGNFETKKHKPDPDPIFKALELLDISKDNVCYVGDGLDDIRCAINAQVKPILLDRLDEYENEPYLIIKNLRELLK